MYLSGLDLCKFNLLIIINFLSDLLFEKSYCEYRLNRLDEALLTIKNADENDMRIQELLGQIVRVISGMYLILLFNF